MLSKIVVVIEGGEKVFNDVDEPVNRQETLIIRRTVSKKDEHSRQETIAVFNKNGWKYWMYK